MPEPKPGEVWAFVRLRRCGCVNYVASLEAFADDCGKSKGLRRAVRQGRVKTVMSREEYNALPWKCSTCEPCPVVAVGAMP